MTKQDEKLRIRRRLQEQAVNMASHSRWQDAIKVNSQIIEIEEDADAYNRLGKAYFEVGKLNDAHDAYQNTLRLNPSNGIARKNVVRLETLLARASTATMPDRTTRQMVDLRLFITEIGRTTVTTLIDVAKTPSVDAIVTGEKVDLQLSGRNIIVYDTDGNVIGRLEPRLAHRLSELMAGGNLYASAVASTNSQHVRILIRETYQDPSQRGRVSFPGRFSEGLPRDYIPATSLDLDEYDEDLLEEESIEEPEDMEEENFNSDEEDLGLDAIEQDINDDDDMNEE
ncbi:MAG: hypothetical protein GFH27_549293n267 [Chloroflexi bacterium AL-W]|nr:hypothetical protein [Chloroflexi bacterium AL-N1]NOK67618.1 hypothetical protein [Chloroflexi bacterium AL-N10]NOK75612.1 hypothetical protein [Chloroflexi bacterium AL-N5]NOK82400.1 hypothetical protein [Chloroflexi bacterium AL-W]NOK90245.1 hypothetical protein [Chloroflexi bacterium AL-N15]